MTDGKDSKDLNEGTVSAANAEGSNQEGSTLSSNAVAETAKQIKALQDKIDAMSRAMQSDKDKAVAKTNQRIDRLEGDLKSVLREAMKNGQSVQDILAEVEQTEERETRETLRELALAYRQGSLSNDGGRGSQPSEGAHATKVVSDLELDQTDVRVKAFMSRSFGSEAEAYKEAALLIKSIATKQPSEADIPSNVGGTHGPNKLEALQQEYNTRSQNLRGNALIALKMEMRKKGLPIS